MSAPFRFGVNLMRPESRSDWIEKCRRAEQLGYDVVSVPDHLGLPAPFPAMVQAAEATERVRLITFVLNVPFYNPALLAREVATVDLLTDGRVELGLGAGYVRAEFEAAGIPFPGAGQRVDQVAEAAATLRRLYADPEYQPRPARPGGPPLLIAGWGDRLLRVAAEHADIIGVTGGTAADSGHIALAGPEATAQRLDYARGLLGERAGRVEFNILLQVVAPAAERARILERYAANLPEGTGDDLEDIPVVVIGSPAEMADQLRERRKRYGISYFTVLEPNMEKFAPVLEQLR
ncbi:putative F420-dependent oxidoreductase [Nocardia transvalensis]|uniref:Putative F420-dependent oxidoreductase n=1 Tax=Nocardia transvalensis TaxID=37333 RepID=A0A7W9PJL3_9NOCA|nr:TIGR03621 family F420-dependent LLM class oxidoreductase [Nocardia transvalensis]MBB5916918.1 putative F420-dependent oxidoreductase [Nocardia transvalensis]